MPSILFVDDDVLRMAAFVRVLEDAGYRVTPATTAQEALRLARANSFEIVLLDIVMPPGRVFTARETAGGYKTGIALAREIRNFLPDAKLVAFTLSNDPEVLEWFSDDPLLGYINKAETLDLGLPEILELVAHPETGPPPFLRRDSAEHSVFLSHSSGDKPFVRRLARAIERQGIPVWLDEHAISGGTSILGEVADGISKTSHFVLVLSPEAVASEWVRRELDIALTKNISGRTVRVVPVLHRDCDLPAVLRPLRYVDMRKSRAFSRGVADLMYSIRTSTHR